MIARVLYLSPTSIRVIWQWIKVQTGESAGRRGSIACFRDNNDHYLIAIGYVRKWQLAGYLSLSPIAVD